MPLKANERKAAPRGHTRRGGMETTVVNDLPVERIVGLIIGDFEDTWEALAAKSDPNLHRGNFLFALLAVILLEVACRLCHSDSKDQALSRFSDELEKRDSRYFTEFPGSCWSPRDPPEFYLPSRGPNQESQLIAALFDLIRNGQAHQYQQIRVQLKDCRNFRFALTGAAYGRSLSQISTHERYDEHLRVCKDESGDLWMKVRTDVLFLDIRDAIRDADLLNGDLTLKHLSRSSGGKHYQFSSGDLESRLQSGGHF